MRKNDDYPILSFIAVAATFSRLLNLSLICVLIIGICIVLAIRLIQRKRHFPTIVVIAVLISVTSDRSDSSTHAIGFEVDKVFQQRFAACCSSIDQQTKIAPSNSFQSPVLSYRTWIDCGQTKIEDFWNRLSTFFLPTERRWADAVLRGRIFVLSTNVIVWFKETGLFHLLVVSGFHFALFLGMIEQIVLIPFRLIYSMLPIAKQVPYQIIIGLKCGVAICGYFLLSFLGSTPPAQRALCCFIVAGVLAPQMQRYSLRNRIEGSIFLHAVVFPAGLASNSGILSWLIYLSVLSWKPGLCGRVITQAEIFLIVCVCFLKVNLAAFFLNFLSPILGTMMMISALIPALCIFFGFESLRFWNLQLIGWMLDSVRMAGVGVREFEDMICYMIGSKARWFLTVTWCLIFLRKSSKI